MKILLVENDCCISELLTEVLTERNFIVEAVFNGLAPLQFIQKYDCDLILLNVVLPKLDGICLCRQLRAEGYSKPIIFLSSIDTPELSASAKEAGGDDYLLKPFKIEQLLNHINNLLNPPRVQSTLLPIINFNHFKNQQSQYLPQQVYLS